MGRWLAVVFAAALSVAVFVGSGTAAPGKTWHVGVAPKLGRPCGAALGLLSADHHGQYGRYHQLYAHGPGGSYGDIHVGREAAGSCLAAEGWTRGVPLSCRLREWRAYVRRIGVRELGACSGPQQELERDVHTAGNVHLPVPAASRSGRHGDRAARRNAVPENAKPV